ncbi:MAG: hypothetical protein U0V70_18785 [Terriglobia bacterium]
MKVRSEWHALLSPRGQSVFETARNEIESHSLMLDVAMNEALSIKQLGDIDEAIRFLNIGGEIIEKFTPNLLSLLAVMTKFSRMVSAIAPVDPLIPKDFHLGELVSLAHLHRLMHQVVVSTKQRFRLRIYVLAKGISIASHYLINKITDLVTHRSQDQKEWREIVEIEQDFNTLSRESLRSFRALLEVLSSEDARRLSQDLRTRTTPSHRVNHIT